MCVMAGTCVCVLEFRVCVLKFGDGLWAEIDDIHVCLYAGKCVCDGWNVCVCAGISCVCVEIW